MRTKNDSPARFLAARESGRLVELVPGKPVDVALYWQFWRLNVQALQRMTAAVEQAARTALLP